MLIFRQEVLSQHKSERGGDEELCKEQRDAFTLCQAQGELKWTPWFKQGAGLRRGAQCTQLLETTHTLLECHCRSALAESRERSTWHQREKAHCIPDQPQQVPHCQANRRELSYGMGGKQPRAAHSLSNLWLPPERLFPGSLSPCSLPTAVSTTLQHSHPPVLLILQLLQALKLLKTQQNHCALKGWTNPMYSPQPDKYNCFRKDRKNPLEDFSPPAGNKIVDCCRFLTSQADCLAI